ncbi:hypothetical protein [Flavobacterium johnsoniae]|uniref:Uncharacterized protein n=1 Tax=Flavobacterium johnsoniae (strain ATCC 17061 / DSM 2064 / JCM 8514 / BCRC 14874 / CCUG 350202 / NBRC 14942 / NCIMB 11054 / UW101) TaxID=376686 RepID=A5FK65_FLAJ1|nr:hypothetical protein [Flavobacterium johnsoniae]ABQ04412.1 hypothetical protein Fjoh_1380 [Flavobacterium johnsoniae UW101]OXE97737.1 hypothetical protein B0A63_16525 [Flavobacterium johnsoniae UW101]WQG83794.1 hypothetical protein SR927_11860 [Flavobacterium johnsoniae UW101]SHK21785.1 hypothetical protein SAMN05444146_0807 [Flavobacterium johnsoniae]
MKKEILDRIKELGGNINNVKGKSLLEDLQSITFNTVLYKRPEDTPWASAEDEEPIYGIGDFVDENETLFKENKEAFYDKIIEQYFRLTDEGFGQMFWKASSFTPFKEGTQDYTEWYRDFTDPDIDLSETIKITNDSTPDFIFLIYSYGFPDSYYIVQSDPNPENPTLFSTDRTGFFSEVTNEGNLEDFMNTFMTKEELLELLKNKLGS